jgi:uncharacterized protein
MAQNWHNLLFAHWPVLADKMRRLLPGGLELDVYDGQAWISVVPFTMSGVRLRGTPVLPWLSVFPELNVRTYVTAGGMPGVWFFSLDAGNPVAVQIARAWFHLPYFHARMKSKTTSEGTIYSAQRLDPRGESERLEAIYSARGPGFETKRGTLEHFLTERYCLYAQKANHKLLRGEIHHAPWILQEAHASFLSNTMMQNLGIETPGPPAVLHFSKLQEVLVWRPQVVRV